MSNLLRLRLAILEHGRTVAIALLVIGVVSLAGAAVAYSQPQSVEVSEQAHVQTVTSTVETSAIVTGESSLWDTGERLENRPFYPDSAPVLTLRATTSTVEGDPVRVTQTMTLTYQAMRDDTVVWQRSEVVSRVDETAADGAVSAAGTVDTRAVGAEVDRINDEMRGVGSARVLVRLNVTYDTGRYNGTLSASAPLVVAANGYWIDGHLGAEQVHSTPVTSQVAVPPARWSYLWPALLGLGSVVGAGVVRVLRARSPDRLRIRDRLERSRYAEWISSGYLAGDLGDRQVQLRTLGDLVDIGIDSDKRTIHDSDRGLYGVIDGDVLYYYPTADQSDDLPDDWEWPFDDAGEPGLFDGHGAGSDRLDPEQQR